MNKQPPRLLTIIFLCLLLLPAGCGPPRITPKAHQKKRPGPATQRPYRIGGKTYYPVPSADGYTETGTASWYGKKFHGRKTSNGEVYDMYAETAAHKTLPMGTMLEVSNLDNGKTTVVRINDRGPFVKGRIIDLSYTAAKKLGLIAKGTARVRITALGEVIPEQKPSGSASVRLKHQDFHRGRFFVQVGSFEHLDNARKLARLFADRGKDVIIQDFPAAGTRFYRVLVFAATTLEQAEQYEKKLEKSGYPNALIIAR